MTALIAALSLSDKIKEYGAYAGFAAVLGLGVLSLLYFAQAREVKRLRDWAGRAPERAAELEARVTSGAQERAAWAGGASAGLPTFPSASAARSRTSSFLPRKSSTRAGAASAAPSKQDVAKADMLGRFINWKMEQPFEEQNIFMLFQSILSFLEVQGRVIRYLVGEDIH